MPGTTGTYDVNKITEELYSANAQYNRAVAISSGIQAAKDRLKNLLFHNRDAILSSFSDIEKVQKQLDMTQTQVKNLTQALDESDEENDVLRERIKELEADAVKNAAKGARSKKGVTA